MKIEPTSTNFFAELVVGPDSTIDPSEQVTFYDPGLGSPRDNHFAFGWIGRKIYNLISEATGFGITANIIDCYAALIRLWRPGDRIFLFGFSRGAYTVRCLAAVIANCGIPALAAGGEKGVICAHCGARPSTYPPSGAPTVRVIKGNAEVWLFRGKNQN